MKVTFDVQSRLPEGMGQEFQSKALAELLGPEIRIVHQRIESADYYTVEAAIAALQALLQNELVIGVQATFKGLR